MCRYTAVLYQKDAKCAISCCDHNAVHLRWKRLNLTMTHTEFLGFGRFIACQYANAYWGDCNCLKQLPDGRYEVAFGDVTLRLNGEDLLDFGHMCEVALNRLDGSTPARFAKTYAKPKLREPQALQMSAN